MSIILLAVVTASLLGSLHCVGMCGPLALWAAGASDNKWTARQTVLATSLYHLGRLSTYVGVGLVAGSIGSFANASGSAIGIQVLAARIAGATMIFLGLAQLYRILNRNRPKPTKARNIPLKPSLIAKLLVEVRPWVFSLPLHLRGLFTGAVTPFLPCGWLYLFALVAAGTGSTPWGGMVMLSFWVGTVPALTLFVAGFQQLSTRFRSIIPITASVLLIVSGGTTFGGRGFANLNSAQLLPQAERITQQTSQQSLQTDALLDEKLPCCCTPDDAPSAQAVED